MALLLSEKDREAPGEGVALLLPQPLWLTLAEGVALPALALRLPPLLPLGSLPLLLGLRV